MVENVHSGNQSTAGQDPFEMFRRLWAPLGLPVPGMAMPTLDPAEVEKRISDLKSVETWLAMNLNMVKMAIQGLEVQKLALNAMQANAGAAGDAANAFANFSRAATPSATPTAAENHAASPNQGSAPDLAAQSMSNPMLWPWAIMQSAATQASTTQTSGRKAGDQPIPKSAGSDSKPGKHRKGGK